MAVFASMAPLAMAMDSAPGAKIATPSQLERGHAIAKANCAVCHAVDASDGSPTWVNSNTTFRRLSERFPIPMLEQALDTGTISGHDEMPGFQFSIDEVTALIAYIDSLAPASARYLERGKPR